MEFDTRPSQTAPTAADQKTIDHRILAHVARIVFALGGVLLAIVFWLADTWPNLSIDEVVFHMRASLDGTDSSTVVSLCLHYLPIAFITCAVVYLLLWRLKRTNPKLRSKALIATLVVGIVMGSVAFYKFGTMVDIGYLLSAEHEDFIGEEYVDPATVTIEFPQKKKNLVYIFLESMELTYASADEGGAEETNLIPELTELAHEGETFNGNEHTLNGAMVLPGCTWTMGGLFCQSSGVPLKLPMHGNHSQIALEDFFPGMTCLGDILEQNGYQQYALFGSNASFGNRREYYTEHGSFDIFDYKRAIQDGFIPKGYKVWWGFEDEKLFAKAKETIEKASADDKPFNVTLLTVDTHFEDGYVCRLCKTEHGDNQYANVMSCSSRQVSEFVRWIQSQDFGKDTVIVINGDHTTMDKDFCNNIPSSYTRKTFTTILNGAAKPTKEQSRNYATIDLFPTTLAALGCSIEGDRLGVGTNLYSDKQTLVEEFGLGTVRREFSHQSELLNSYSNAPTGDELVDMVLNSKKKMSIIYQRTDDSATTGFLLKRINLFNREVVESGRLELTDTRTHETQYINMVLYDDNINRTTEFYLLAPIDIPDDELQYYEAEAYVTITDANERVFATWSGADQGK